MSMYNNLDDKNKKLYLLASILWALLILFFIFIFGLFDVPFYVEYDEPIEVRVSYGRGFEYEELEGSITVVGWSMVALSLVLSLRITAELANFFKSTPRIGKQNREFTLIDYCIIGTSTFSITEAVLFKALFFRIHESSNLGHFSFLNFAATITHIILILIIYTGCKRFYEKSLDKNGKF